jgi:glycosyltransferase involved in cell wall biosynthesis
MASGLPIVSSVRGPMPEVLGDGGVYFDPEKAEDIARLYRRLSNRQNFARRSPSRHSSVPGVIYGVTALTKRFSSSPYDKEKLLGRFGRTLSASTETVQIDSLDFEVPVRSFCRYKLL